MFCSFVVFSSNIKLLITGGFSLMLWQEKYVAKIFSPKENDLIFVQVP
jgi:hypothetical protein